jgi:MFS superfamily sulfate permease-like transporter
VLDVAAISMDMGEALDTDKELITVGASNMISGLFGGFTGSYVLHSRSGSEEVLRGRRPPLLVRAAGRRTRFRRKRALSSLHSLRSRPCCARFARAGTDPLSSRRYIFSQTIFQFRTKVWSRWIGLLVAGSELVVFSIETDLLSMSPLFFFGATLIFIGFDLLVEWLCACPSPQPAPNPLTPANTSAGDVREKVSNTELLVLVSTFTLIHIVGIDFGVIAGIVLSIMEYTIGNAALADDFQFVKRVERRSRKVRSLERWRKIQQLCYSGNVVTFELRGVLCKERESRLIATTPVEVGGGSGGLPPTALL